MVSHHNVIVASVDARGSGRRGNKMMHATYKQIGQFEREDASDFAAYLLLMYPALDPKRVGIWGWSFGGYATTHSLLYPDSTFTTGVAVAPLVSRFNYDSMHTERYMDLPENNKLNYDKCSILNQDLENMRNKQYAIISGTMDDNVHFQVRVSLDTKVKWGASYRWSSSLYRSMRKTRKTHSTLQRFVVHALIFISECSTNFKRIDQKRNRFPKHCK